MVSNGSDPKLNLGPQSETNQASRPKGGDSPNHQNLACRFPIPMTSISPGYCQAKSEVHQSPFCHPWPSKRANTKIDSIERTDACRNIQPSTKMKTICMASLPVILYNWHEEDNLARGSTRETSTGVMNLLRTLRWPIVIHQHKIKCSKTGKRKWRKCS